MKSTTKEIIVSEIRQTKTVYEKLLISLTTPVLLTIFKQLFGRNGEFSLSDKGFDCVVEELESQNRLPETNGEKITDALLVDIFTDFYTNQNEDNPLKDQMPSVDEQSTPHLTLDDLLDLLNIAMKHHDILYANELKRRLLVLNRNHKNSIEAS
ncbi:hypothetical protein F7984_07660 [Pradoshia sp. D12]|uniref:hypothetical protein n=1 Tax=Bacillaceae TaxID=186817 RepID=UPI001122F6B4|nr:MULTISPECIES: hypothetical protein [Bacillaceae]QFK71131.1 hypothetical protein F7984_07660 [Pradoshia sp. D12]TPF72924.1 hypothetical protein FHY44_04050 [Bacillus sp. D12]